MTSTSRFRWYPVRSLARRSGRVRWLMLLILGIAVGGIAWLTRTEFEKRRDLANDAPNVMLQLVYEAPQRGFGRGTPVSPAEFESFAKTQAVLVKSRPLIERALIASRETENSLGAQGTLELPRWVESRLRVDFLAPEILRIAFDCSKREPGVNFLNVLAREYLNDVWDTERRGLLHRLNHLDLLAKELSNTMRKKQHEAKELAVRIGGDADEQFIAARFRAYESALSELHRLRLESFRMQSEQEFLRKHASKSPTDRSNAELEQVSRAVAISQITLERVEKEVMRMEEILKGMTRKSIEISILAQQLAAIESVHRQVIEQMQQIRIELVESDVPTADIDDTTRNATWSRVRLISSAH